MTEKALWQKLKLLVDLDQSSLSTITKIEDLKQSISRQEQLIKELEQRIEEKKLACTKEKKQVHEHEITAQTLKTQEEEKRKILDNLHSGNQKEFTALQKEIKLLTQERSAHEDVLVNAWYQLELSTKHYEDMLTEAKTRIEQLSEEIKKKKQEIVEREQFLQEHEQNRQTISNNIPAEWLSRYNRMKYQVPDPIVPVITDTCSSCFYSILPIDLSKLKKSEIILCRNCYRFLFYDKTTEQEAAQARY